MTRPNFLWWRLVISSLIPFILTEIGLPRSDRQDWWGVTVPAAAQLLHGQEIETSLSRFWLPGGGGVNLTFIWEPDLKERPKVKRKGWTICSFVFFSKLIIQLYFNHCWITVVLSLTVCFMQSRTWLRIYVMLMSRQCQMVTVIFKFKRTDFLILLLE